MQCSNRGDAQLHDGDRVEVRTRFLGDWTGGFEVASIRPDGCQLRRVSDGALLPLVFPYDDVRPVADEPMVASANAAPQFELLFERPDLSRLVVRLPATLDIAAVEAVRVPILAAADAARDEVVLDLDPVSFLDTYGIRLLVTLRRRAWERDVPVRLRGGDPLIRSLLDLVAVDPMYVPTATDQEKTLYHETSDAQRER